MDDKTHELAALKAQTKINRGCWCIYFLGRRENQITAKG